MTNDESGLFNVKLIESKITIGDRKYLKAEKIGSLKLAYIVNKATTTITLKNVKYAPQLCVNLLSIPAALSNGYNIGNEGQYLYLQKGNFKLKFDKLFSSGKSSVCGIYMQPILQDAAYPALEEVT